MERISVVGLAGSGKTTLAQTVGRLIGAPVTELDEVVWGSPGWQRRPDEEVRDRLDESCSGSRWIIDGYLGSLTEEVVWPRADTVIWLDLPRHLILRQAGRRSVRRIVRRQELWGGNRESLRDLLSWSPDRSVLRWIWTQHPARRQHFVAASADPAWEDLTFTRLRSRADIERLVVELGDD